MTARICFVEDDPTIRELVSEKLERSLYQVESFSKAEDLPTDLSSYDLFILDVLLEGDLTGLQACERIRIAFPEVPILILSALSATSDRIEGLRLGADDYLGKPFDMEELLLRVRGMLKRREYYQLKPKLGEVFQWEAGEIDFVKRKVKTKKETLYLSHKESMILKLLIDNEGSVVSREEILDKVWGYHLFPSNRTVDNFMVRIRKIFEEDPAKPRYFESVWGEGYRFLRKREAK